MGQEAKKLISNSLFVFIGTLVGSVFSYVFNMLVGRWLGPEQYGEFAAILSLLTIVSVFGGTFSTVTMKYASELFAEEKFDALKKMLVRFSQIALYAGLGLFLICLLFLKPISSFLAISNNNAILIALFGIIFGFLLVVNKGVLQGAQRFLSLSIISVIEPIIKLLFGAILIKLGFALFGAMLGIVLTSMISYFICFLPLKKLFQKHKKQKGSFVFDKKGIIAYSAPAFLATVLLAISLNMDVLLIKHYFSAEQAGLYAAISTIAKIILYTSGPIISVMFPMISAKATKGDKHYKIFIGSLAFTFLCGLVILAIYYIAPGTVIKVLYGAKYAEAFALLPPVGFAFLLYSLVNLVSNYFLSIREFKFLYLFVLTIALQVFLIATFHSSIEIVVKIIIATLGLLFMSMVLYYLFTKRAQLISFFKGQYGE